MDKNILILVDMEGCAGVTDMKQYDVCKKKMIEEAERVIQLIEECGNACITVADCHNDGKNIVEYFTDKGYACYEHVWSIQNMEKYDCAMLIGFHPKNGEVGFCPHTLRPDVDELFLGEKSIGEVELMINWLAGHGVPVIFVSGDSAVKEELDDYDCEFYATSDAVKEYSERQQLLVQMKLHIKKALDLPREKKTHYKDSPIKVKLIGESYYKWLPRELFLIDNERVVFPDTENFIFLLLPFCRFLNIAEEYQRLRMHYLVRKAKSSDVCMENDRRGNNLLNKKDWRALSDEEIGYLYRLLETKQDEQQ